MIYRAKLKTRKQMERDIDRADLGWWHDVCPGQTLELRDARPEDLARCSLREGRSRDPADYLCETFERGSLVHRKAVATLTPVSEAELDQRVRFALHQLGPERFARALASLENRPATSPKEPQTSEL